LRLSWAGLNQGRDTGLRIELPVHGPYAAKARSRSAWDRSCGPARGKCPASEVREPSRQPPTRTSEAKGH